MKKENIERNGLVARQFELNVDELQELREMLQTIHNQMYPGGVELHTEMVQNVMSDEKISDTRKKETIENRAVIQFLKGHVPLLKLREDTVKRVYALLQNIERLSYFINQLTSDIASRKDVRHELFGDNYDG